MNKNTQSINNRPIEIERMIVFYKYLVIFLMCEALKERKKVDKKRTLSRERDLSIVQSREWFKKDNKLLQLYCFFGEIDINLLFEEYERRIRNKTNNNYLKPIVLKKCKKMLTL